MCIRDRQYDDDSMDAIAGLLASHFVKECCDALQSPASFSGAAHLPALLDACRASLVMRPVAAARALSALYSACTLVSRRSVTQPCDAPPIHIRSALSVEAQSVWRCEANWTDAIASADRLLCTGL